MSETQSIKPRFIAGSATPIGPDRDPHPQPEPLLPPDVKIVERSIEISDYTKDGVNEAIEQRYWPCADALVREGAKSINLAASRSRRSSGCPGPCAQSGPRSAASPWTAGTPDGN